MFVKKFKRKCSVRGCKNVEEVYLISKRREMGNTVGMCRSCLEEALKTLDGYTEPEKVIQRENKPLFPHPELEVTLSSAIDIEPKPQEVIEEVAEDFPIVAEDTVTIDAEFTPAEAPKPKATTTTTKGKKKPNKKK